MNVTVAKMDRNPTIDALIAVTLVLLILVYLRVLAHLKTPMVIEYTLPVEEVTEDGGGKREGEAEG